MGKDRYNEKLKNLLKITTNNSESMYRKNINIDDVDTESILTFDNFGFNDRSSSNAEFDDNDFLINYSFGDQEKIDEIVYRINKDGFRTHHFKLNTENKKIILTSGCSFAFGQYLPEEYSWPKILESELNKNKNEYLVYNLSYPGSNYFLTIKNIFSFIKKYGNPEAIFISFPNLNRDIYYSTIKKEFIAQVVNVSHVFKGNDDMQDFVINYDEGANFIKTVAYVNALELFCNTNKIKLFWTTWCSEEVELLNKIKFDNYFISEQALWQGVKYISKNTKSNEYKKTIPDKFLRFWELAADKSHPGINWNYQQSDFFLNLYRNYKSDIIRI